MHPVVEQGVIKAQNANMQMHKRDTLVSRYTNAASLYAYAYSHTDKHVEADSDTDALAQTFTLTVT